VVCSVNELPALAFERPAALVAFPEPEPVGPTILPPPAFPLVTAPLPLP
jgi:hypothetical protein